MLKRNPMNNISIYKIEKPGAGENETSFITLDFTGQGLTAYALHGFGDHVIGKTRGYGYDKTSELLEQAVDYLYGINLQCGGQGESVAIRKAAEHGITIKTLSDMIWSR